MIIHHDFSNPGQNRRATAWQGDNPDSLFVGFDLGHILSPIVMHGPAHRHLALARLMRMGRAEFERHLPRQIFSPLVSGQFDALDLAAKLRDLGYRGSYRALVSGLPNVALVCREIALACPEVDFDILEIGGLMSAGEILARASCPLEDIF